MIKILFNGIELGVVLAFLIGPVFFTIIQTSIERGFWRGVLVAAGVSLSDTLCVMICYLGFAQVVADSRLKVYLAYGGGALLLAFGIYHLFVKGSRRAMEMREPMPERNVFHYLLKGFLINGMTPMVLFFWIGTVSLATLDFGYTTTNEFVLFFASVLLTVLFTDILKAYLADKLRKIVTPKSLRIMNIVLGILLILFGARLLLTAKSLPMAPKVDSVSRKP